MKILLGSHGVGKSTLLKAVREQFPNYYVTDGFSRPVIRMGKTLDLSNNEKQYMINELSAWAYENYITHNNVISTRSLVDCIIYSQILAPQVDIENIVTLFEETKHQVEYFFYIPIEFGFVYDPERLNEELQNKVDSIIVGFMEAHIPAEKIIKLTGSVEERLEIISKYL